MYYQYKKNLYCHLIICCKPTNMVNSYIHYLDDYANETI